MRVCVGGMDGKAAKHVGQEAADRLSDRVDSIVWKGRRNREKMFRLKRRKKGQLAKVKYVCVFTTNEANDARKIQKEHS